MTQARPRPTPTLRKLTEIPAWAILSAVVEGVDIESARTRLSDERVRVSEERRRLYEETSRSMEDSTNEDGATSHLGDTAR